MILWRPSVGASGTVGRPCDNPAQRQDRQTVPQHGVGCFIFQPRRPQLNLLHNSSFRTLNHSRSFCLSRSSRYRALFAGVSAGPVQRLRPASSLVTK
jgi:hypothetical protein